MKRDKAAKPAQRNNEKLPTWYQRLHKHCVHFLSVSTIHGLVHLVRPQRTLCEKLVWIVCMILVAIPCALISREAWIRYWHHPVVTTLQIDHWVWTHTFPGITVCPTTFDQTTIQQDGFYHSMIENGFMFENISAIDPLEDQIRAREFLEILFFGNLSSYYLLGKYKTWFSNISPSNYLRLNIALVNLNLDVSEFFNNEEKLEIHKIVTEFGICWTTNLMFANHLAAGNYYSTAKNMSANRVLITTPGQEEPQLDFKNIPFDLKLFFHSFNEIPSLQDKPYFVASMKIVVAEMQATKLWARDEVKRLSVSQRQCRFPDESDLQYFQVYSTNLCKIECRIYVALKRCKCIPYYYPALYGEKICNIDGMICLSQHAYELTELVDKSTGNSLCDHCDAKCENEDIRIMDFTTNDWVFDTIMQLKLLNGFTLRLQKSVIFSETDFLVQIGGLFGLAYGIGILSIVEIIYFLTIRFYWAVIRRRAV